MFNKINISATKDTAFTPHDIENWERESYPVLFCLVHPWNDNRGRGNEIDYDTEIDNFVIHADEIAEFLKAETKQIDWDTLDIMDVFDRMKKGGFLDGLLSLPFEFSIMG